MPDVLVTTRVVKPGAYIGRVNRPTPTGLTGFVRLPCYVGKGSRLRTVFNDSMRRSYLRDVAMPFPGVAPHIVALAQPAINDQTVAVLERSDGNVVSPSKWRFFEATPGSGVYDSVLMLPEVFDPTVSYTLSYQSSSRTIRDELLFDDIRQVRFVGNAENQDLYVEFVNFFIPVSITTPTADVDNANSASTDEGYLAAQITGTAAAPFNFTGGEILSLTINGVAMANVVFAAGATTSAASAAAQINAVISAQGIAIAEDSGRITIRSNSNDPGISAVVVNVGTANAVLGTTGLSFPTAGSALGSAGYFRRVSGTGTSMLHVGPTSTSGHGYNRRYRVTIGTVAATIPATIEVIQDSGASIPAVASGASITAASMFGTTGTGTMPQLPLHSGFTSTSTQVDFGAPGGALTINFTDITGDQVVLVLDDTGSATDTGDVFETSVVGPSTIEIDSAVLNTVQHASFSAVGSGAVTQVASTPNWSLSIGGAATGTGAVTLRANAEYTGSANRRYLLVCTASAGGAGARTATFVWQAWGEYDDLRYNGAGRTFTISEATGTNSNVSLGDGVSIDLAFGASNFAVDDAYWFQANAARAFISAKDDREYILDVSAVGVSGSDNVATFSYQTGTPEGSFGIVSATGPSGALFLPGGVRLYVRNLGSQVTAANRFAVADRWTFDTVCDDVIDWSLTTRASETINTTQVYTDALGVITGTVGLKYVVLSNIPTQILYVRDTVTGALITSYSMPSTTQPYLAFTTAPVNPIEVRYETVGQEPAPGNIYYITANTVRPTDLYETPLRALSDDEAGILLGPSSATNDLYIAAQLALTDNDAPGAYFCQARDLDGDGVINPIDINRAIEATEDVRTLTDVIVLNSFSSLSASMANNEKMNDPFERGERALWVGAPVGTQIGDEATPGTLVYLATRTLQVFGENPAHGTRVLCGNVEATKTITLSDGSNVVVTLDGSFIAGALAAKNASFEDPGQTLLRQNLFGFDSMKVYSEPDELLLNGASIIWCSNQGSDDAPVFRIEESTTVDRSSDDNNEISVAINQKQFVTREIRTQMDNSLIAIVPPSEQAGVAIIQTFLVERLAGLVARGIIGPYQDENGNPRPIDPNSDVEVFRAKDSKTLYNFKYYWFGRYPIKRLFGLYSVDRKFFGQQV
jgi:hypothetical protein